MNATFLSPRLAEVCRTRLGSPGSACIEAAVHGVFKTSPSLITESNASICGRSALIFPPEVWPTRRASTDGPSSAGRIGGSRGGLGGARCMPRDRGRRPSAVARSQTCEDYTRTPRVGELQPELYFLGVGGQFHEVVKRTKSRLRGRRARSGGASGRRSRSYNPLVPLELCSRRVGSGRRSLRAVSGRRCSLCSPARLPR